MSESKQFFVYFLSNRGDTVLYIGVTNNLQRRLHEHLYAATNSFVARYHLRKLVYFEVTDSVYSAIQREKQFKGWKRCKKDALIASKNPRWVDLQETDFRFSSV
jgi:putative endonuclease